MLDTWDEQISAIVDSLINVAAATTNVPLTTLFQAFGDRKEEKEEEE